MSSVLSTVARIVKDVLLDAPIAKRRWTTHPTSQLLVVALMLSKAVSVVVCKACSARPYGERSRPRHRCGVAAGARLAGVYVEDAEARNSMRLPSDKVHLIIPNTASNAISAFVFVMPVLYDAFVDNVELDQGASLNIFLRAHSVEMSRSSSASPVSISFRAFPSAT